MIDNLSRFILQDRRQYFIHKVKDLLRNSLIDCTSTIESNKFLAKIRLLWHVWGIVIAVGRYPEPTKENTFHPNTHVLLDAFAKFFQTKAPGREPLFRAIRKIVIDEHEHDPWYRDIMNSFLELLVEAMLKGKWKPRPLVDNLPTWGVEPSVRGIGYEFMKDRYYHDEKYRSKEVIGSITQYKGGDQHGRKMPEL